MMFRQFTKFQLFREVDGIEIFKVGGDIVPEKSRRCVRNCLFTKIGSYCLVTIVIAWLRL